MGYQLKNISREVRMVYTKGPVIGGWFNLLLSLLEPFEYNYLPGYISEAAASAQGTPYTISVRPVVGQSWNYIHCKRGGHDRVYHT